MLTFAQWREERIRERVAEYGCTRSDAAYGLAPGCWWSQHVLPNLRAGQVLSWAVCRSIAENGYRLVWIAKNYEGSIPTYCDVKTGKQIKRGW